MTHDIPGRTLRYHEGKPGPEGHSFDVGSPQDLWIEIQNSTGM